MEEALDHKKFQSECSEHAAIPIEIVEPAKDIQTGSMQRKMPIRKNTPSFQLEKEVVVPPNQMTFQSFSLSSSTNMIRDSQSSSFNISKKSSGRFHTKQEVGFEIQSLFRQNTEQILLEGLLNQGYWCNHIFQKLKAKIKLQMFLRETLYYLISVIGWYKIVINAIGLSPMLLPQVCIYVCYQTLQSYDRKRREVVSSLNFNTQEELDKSVAVLKGIEFSEYQAFDTINFLMSLFVTHFLVDETPCSRNLTQFVEMMSVIVSFKAAPVTSEKDLIPRFLGVFFSQIIKIQTFGGTFSNILSVSVCSILLLVILAILLYKDGIDSLQEWPSVHPIYRNFRKWDLKIDPLVWETEEKSSLIVQKTQHEQQSSNQNNTMIKQSQGSSSKKESKGSKQEEKIEYTFSNTNSVNCSSFIINNEQSDVLSIQPGDEVPSEMRSDRPQNWSNSLEQALGPEVGTRFIHQSRAINDYYLNYLSNGFMLCKLSQATIKRKSEQQLNNCDFSSKQEPSAQSMDFKLNKKSQNSKFTQKFQRKMKMYPVQKSENFMTKLPFFNEVLNLQNMKNNGQRVSRTDQNQSHKFMSTILQQKNILQSSSGDPSVGGSFHNMSSHIAFQKERMSAMRDMILNQELSPAEEEILELKIYQPYLISNSTIIQFEMNKKFNVKPEKLSIMDILEQYFLQNKAKSSLFFKVNLGDLNELQMLEQQYEIMRRNSSGFLDMTNSLESSFNSKLHDSKKQPLVANMEEIKEQNSEHLERQSLTKNHPRKKRSKVQIRTNRFSQMASKGGRRKKERLSHSDQKRPSRTSQEMNDVILQLNLKQEEEQIVNQRPRSSGYLFRRNENPSLCQQPSKLSSSYSKSDSSLFDEEDFMMNESIEDTNSSTSTFKDFHGTEFSYSQLQTADQQEQQQNLIRYFEFEIKQVDEIKDLKNLTFIVIKDITKLVQNQSKFCDIVYQDAIENNFSHEQMTPLNPILNQSVLVKQKIINLYLEKFGIIPELIDRENLNVEGIDLSDIAIVVKNSNEAKSVIQNLTSIEQAAKLIWYYNTNNIKRMKVKKNQLDIEPTPIHQIDDIIFNVLWPFEHFIFKRRHNVHLIKGITQKMKMFADWRLYELVLFNLVQNSIKYNKNFDGDVVIVTRMKPLKRREFDNLDAEINYVLETMILDTGMGIQEDRQDLLFIPFLELKDRLGIMKTQNDNIGIGLACSKEICKHLGGDIVLKISNKGLTAFSFKVPITVQFDEVEVPSLQLSEQMAPKNDFVIHRLMGSERPIPDCIFDLLELMKVFNNAQVNSMDRQSKSMKSRHHNYAVQQSPVIAMQKYGFQFIETLSQHRSGSQSNSREVVSLKKKDHSLNSSLKSQIGRNNLSMNKKPSNNSNQKGIPKINTPSISEGHNAAKDNEISLQKSKEELKEKASSQAKSEVQQSRSSVSNEERKSLFYLKEDLADRVPSKNIEEQKISDGNEEDSCSFVFEGEEVKANEPMQVNPSDNADNTQRIQNQNLLFQYDNSNDAQNLPRNINDSSKQQTLRPKNPLAVKLAAVGNNNIDPVLRRRCVSELLIQNHKNQLFKRLFSEEREESSDISEEESKVEDIIVNDYPRNKNIPCLRLGDNSDRSEISNSYDYVNLRPQGRNNSQEQPIVIRPSDFILGSEDVHNMRRDEERKAIDENNDQRLDSDDGSDSQDSNEYSDESVSLDGSASRIIESESLHANFANGAAIGNERSPKLLVQEDPNPNSMDLLMDCNCEPRILCADDNDFNLLTINTMMYEKYQMRPEEAQNGEIAVQMFSEAMAKRCRCNNRGYKLIFMDIQMPVMDGYEATVNILKMIEHERSRLGQLPDDFCNIIAITSYTSNEVREKCLKLGMKKVLHKPVNAAQLYAAMEEYFFN